MDVVSSWTGARADALRKALRMTNEAFAERLGAAVRTVAYWRERPASVPQPVMQAALDTVLAQAPEPARAQFWLILTERERTGPACSPGCPSPPSRPLMTSSLVAQRTWNHRDFRRRNGPACHFGTWSEPGNSWRSGQSAQRARPPESHR